MASWDRVPGREDGHGAAGAPGIAAGGDAVTPEPRAGPGPLVAFDFDGTLTVRDSFTAFLRWRTTAVDWMAGALRLAPEALPYLLWRDRGRLKGAAVRAYLRGLPRAALTEEAERFAATHRATLLRPDALQVWAAHGAAGARRVIVTASPEEVVAPFATWLGADALIGSRLAWTADGRVGDGLDGRNCRGAEKVARLKARFGADVVIADAYGDTAGDLEMLAYAQRGHMRAFTGRPA